MHDGLLSVQIHVRSGWTERPRRTSGERRRFGVGHPYVRRTHPYPVGAALAALVYRYLVPGTEPTAIPSAIADADVARTPAGP